MESEERTAAKRGPVGAPAWARWLPAVGVLALLVSLVLWTHPWHDPTLATGDGVIYLLTAKSLLAGEGYSYLGEPFVIRPPGWPVLLLPLVATAGVSHYAVHLFTGLFGVAAILLVVLFYRRRLGLPAACALGAVFWLNPLWQDLHNQGMSDVPGVALLFGGLCLERWAKKRGDLGSVLLLGLFIGLGAYVRSLVLLLAPAIVGARILERLLAREPAEQTGADASWKRTLFLALPILVLPWLVQFPWSQRNAHAEREVPGEHTLFHSYSVAMWHQDWADPDSPRIGMDELRERFDERLPQVAHALGSRLRRGQGDPTDLWLAGLGMAAVAAVFALRREPAEAFALGIALLFTIYFGFSVRLVLPLYCLALGAVAELLQRAVAALSPRFAGAVLALFLAALAVAEAAPKRGWKQVERRHLAQEELATWIETNLDADDRLAANFGAHLSLRLERPVYTLRWAWRRGQLPGVLAFLERERIDVVVLDPRQVADRGLLQALASRLGCLATFEGGVCVMRVAP